MKILISGAGIGGLTTALALRKAGHDVAVFEQVPEIKALGVGINLLPHAVGVLFELGLEAPLAATAIDAKEYVYMNRHGQEILADARGLSAGYAYPQYSIHRGELQMILLDAATRALGAENIRTNARLVDFTDDGRTVHARFADRMERSVGEASGDLLIAAEGIHSFVRARFYPNEGLPKWNGAIMWRGLTVGRPFLTGGSIVKAGWTQQKFVVYPISRRHAERGEALINWIADLHTDGTDLAAREDWNRPGRLQDFLPQFQDWRFPWLDVPQVIRNAEACYEFPMVDRDPVDRWSLGRVTLLGDAAHPMYPIASNGASQAIHDAQAIAGALARHADVETALSDYESQRRPPTAEIVRMNREQGPDVILDMVHERAPGGFTHLDDVLPKDELAAIVSRYKRAAGHQQRTTG